MRAHPGRGTFVLVPGAGGAAWYWHRVAGLLGGAGREALAVELPGEDEQAHLTDYADQVAEVAGSRRSLILVAQSLAGFIAPLVCARVPVRALVLVNAMIPLPGERAGDWWESTGAVRAREAAAREGGYPADFDVDTYFLHDVPAEILRGAPAPRSQARGVFGEPCPFSEWPALPMRIIAAAADRFLPPAFQRRVALERCGAPVEVIPGGHLAALSQPHAVVGQLLSFEEEILALERSGIDPWSG